jgi:O-antigen ligase
MVFPAVMRDAPVWGFGPGSGPAIYAQYSAQDPAVRYRPGRRYEWHSLYQHVAVETGGIGSVALLIILAFLIRTNYRWWKHNREITPLLGTLGFMIIGLTISGLDAASGLFLGFGLLVDPPEHVS